MWHLSRQNRSRQIIGRNFFEPKQLPGPSQIRTPDQAYSFLNRNNYLVLVRFGPRTRRIRYHWAKPARHTTNFEFIMNQGTTSSMSPVDKEKI